MRFSDGMEFNTDGEYRLTFRSDGWYVVGGGMLLPVRDAEEGQKVINEMSSLKRLKEQDV